MCPFVQNDSLQVTFIQMFPRDFRNHNFREQKPRRKRGNRRVTKENPLTVHFFRRQAAQYPAEFCAAAVRHNDADSDSEQISVAHGPIAATPALPQNQRQTGAAFVKYAEFPQKRRGDENCPDSAFYKRAAFPDEFPQ